MDKLVVSLETAKRLKAVGFPQDIGYFYWTDHGEHVDLHTKVKPYRVRRDIAFAAPTAQELADQLLGKAISIIIYSSGIVSISRVADERFTKSEAKEVNLAEALAEFYLEIRAQKPLGDMGSSAIAEADEQIAETDRLTNKETK